MPIFMHGLESRQTFPLALSKLGRIMVRKLRAVIHGRIPTVKLKIPGKAFLKSEFRTSVTFKNTFYIFHNFVMVADLL